MIHTRAYKDNAWVAWIVMLWVAWWSLGVSTPRATPAPQLRFHHLHYRAADPLSAMRRLTGSAGIQPSILQGLGVGVRIGGEPGRAEYVLFDRPSERTVASQPPIAAMLPRLLDWFRSRGFVVDADVDHIRGLADRLSEDVFDHIAFAASDLPDAVNRLRGAGVRISRTTAESSFVDAGPLSAAVEIVRDPDQPDAFWCSMHPDVRSPSPGTCPICRMALVPIPEPQYGEYRMDVEVLPSRRAAGAAGLRLTLAPPDSSIRPSLLTVHDKRLHLFVIGSDLTYFQHVHPDERSDGRFDWTAEMPAGEYMVTADFTPAGGTPQMVQRAIVTRGWPRATEPAPVALAPSSVVTSEGIRATLVTPTVVAGQTAIVRITLADERTGQAIADLEPYLSAPAHAVMASADLTHVVHVHPQEQETFGPALSFEILPATDGPHKLWVQVQRRGRVVTLPFVLMVRK